MVKALRASLVSTTVLTALAASPAIAQTAEEGDAPTQIETIIVTATLRGEDALDVPIALTAVTGEELAAQGFTSLPNVAEILPNVDLFDTAAGQPTWVIRGVGLLDFNPNNTPTAPIYLDDVYLPSNAMGAQALFDVEQVEVLKGPQGGIYGRNTTGGAVKVISKRPDLSEVEGYARFTYGSFEQANAEGAISVPLIEDQLALRVAASVSSGGAWQENVNGVEWGNDDKYSVRASTLFRPTSAFEARLVIDYSEDNSEHKLNRAIPTRSLAGGPPQFFCPDALEGNSDLSSCVNYGGVLSAFSGSPDVNDPSAISSNSDRVLADPFGKFDTTNLGVTFSGELDLGFAELLSITNYRDFDFGRRNEADGQIGEFGHTDTTTTIDVFSQEFRLISLDDGPFRWIAGVNYAVDDLSEDRLFLFRDNFVQVGGFAAYGVENASQLIANLAYDQTTTMWSAYGQFDYDLTERLTFTGALRYTDESKEYRNGGFNFPLGTGALADTPLVQENANFRISRDYELEDNWSGKATLSFQVTPDVLTYVTGSRAFKSGGFFGGFTLAGGESVTPYTEETVNALELGFKSVFNQDRAGLNGAFFYYDYQDVQALVPTQTSVGVSSVLSNIEGADHIGVELDGFYQVTEALRAFGSVGYLDATFTGDDVFTTPDGQPAPFDGRRRDFASEWSYNVGAEYIHGLNDLGEISIASDVNYRSERSDPNGSGLQETVQTLDGYALWNARLGWRAPSETFGLSIIGRNLADEEYFVSYNNDGLGSFIYYPGTPRTITLALDVQF